MKKIQFALTAIAVAVSLATASCNGSGRQDSQNAEVDSVEVDNKAYVIELAANEPLDFIGPLSTPIIVDFNATWCGPCQQFKPIFEKMAEKYNGKVRFISVDVDRCRDVATEYQVESIPTVLFVSTDCNINRSVGFMNETEFEEAIKAIL